MKSFPSKIKGLCEATWNAAYPDRRPWDQIGDEAQAEWVRVFGVYESLKAPLGSSMEVVMRDDTEHGVEYVTKDSAERQLRGWQEAYESQSRLSGSMVKQRDELAAQLERYQIALNPRRWDQRHMGAWHRNCHDVMEAFRALRELLLQPSAGREPQLTILHIRLLLECSLGPRIFPNFTDHGWRTLEGLRNLGLVMQTDGTDAGGRRYWQLTPDGETHLRRIFALPILRGVSVISPHASAAADSHLECPTESGASE